MPHTIESLADDYIAAPRGEWFTNIERAQRAAFALAHVSDSYNFDVAPSDMATPLGDFMADFLHLCAALGVSFGGVLEKGRFHYAAERREEG